MYTSIILLPSIGAVAAGLRGRALGATGAQVITCACMVVATVLSLVAFYEVALCRSPVTVDLGSWVSTVGLTADWSLLYDDLTVAMLLPVLVVSTCVHVYSVSYMGEDPHTQRFMAYLSMFTAFMLLLVGADSYLLMFVGWEGIGISSFLLIGFWTTRVQAAKSAVLALTVNRVGDLALTVAFFAITWLCASLDYATVLATVPHLNETALTITGLLLLGGAMAKSAQLPLHTWLPAAMEGRRARMLVGLMVLSVWMAMVLSMCVMVLSVWVHSSVLDPVLDPVLDIVSQCGVLPLVLASMDPLLLAVTTANMLGDGHLRRTSFTSQARMCFCFGPRSLSHLQYLYHWVYRPYCGSPISHYMTKEDTHQYSLATLTDPLWTALHTVWYSWSPASSSFVKHVPSFIGLLMSPLMLALWVTEDGTWDASQGVTLFCTEGFTHADCLLLIDAMAGMGLKVTLKRRKTSHPDQRYRLRVAKPSMPLLRSLVLPHMLPCYTYKLGPST